MDRASSRARPAIPYSARTQGREPKLSVSTTWHPTSKNDRCRSAITWAGWHTGFRCTLPSRGTEVVGAEAKRLQVGACGTIENDDAFMDRFYEAGAELIM